MSRYNLRIVKRLVASGTLFGYTISGMLKNFGDSTTSFVSVNHVHVGNESSISQVLRDLWELEAIGINNSKEVLSIANNDLFTFEHNTHTKLNYYGSQTMIN